MPLSSLAPQSKSKGSRRIPEGAALRHSAVEPGDRSHRLRRAAGLRGDHQPPGAQSGCRTDATGGWRVDGQPEPVRRGSTRGCLCAARMGNRRRGWSRDMSEVGSTTSSLRTLAAQPGALGQWLLGVTAAGFVAYGFYEMIHARYLHIRRGG
jgi:hypothetical protein